MKTVEKQSALVLYINADVIGSGDDALGELLMRNFLSTLGDFVKSVSHILLVNGGVRLACEGSDNLDMMRTLEENGVQILSCVTCLNHFGLIDQVRAGRVSNMFSILEVLTSAEKVITP